ncbi:hypothetical protein RRG08_007171 [Elysia crispata]|uniref:Uncharacterized protein n=1 Tax=Elysia crispata TaxID=231223 RepID=A0AAE1E1I8_9GAST|nr:hypothetical protein RRG08_007171 [Elysia crispata]
MDGIFFRYLDDVDQENFLLNMLMNPRSKATFPRSFDLEQVTRVLPGRGSDFGDRINKVKALNPDWLNKKELADAVAAKGAPLLNCIGFIDGTIRPIARPSKNTSEYVTAGINGPMP